MSNSLNPEAKALWWENIKSLNVCYSQINQST